MSKVDIWLEAEPKSYDSNDDQLTITVMENGHMLFCADDAGHVDRKHALDIANWLIDNYGD